jgi:ATP-dependent exoDNAse (exonuclease V) alpha subunit
VAAVQPEAILAQAVDDGCQVVLVGEALEAKHLDHAYAVTVHRSQGATYDRAHVLAAGGGRELAYVALSRARDRTAIHVTADDLDQAVDDLQADWGVERAPPAMAFGDAG